MGFFSRLFGKPDRDDFAHLLLKAARAGGDTRQFKYSSKDFTLTRPGTTEVLNLHNGYDEYRAADSAKRKLILARWARMLSQKQDIPDTLEAARANLLPRIRERVYYEFFHFHSAKIAKKGMTLPHRVVAEHLAAGVIIDLPEAIAECAAEKVDKWNISLDELLKIARENLWKISNEDFKSPQSGLYVSAWRDNHDCSRLFLHDLIWQLKVNGSHIAMVPNRDTLLVTGSDDEAGLKRMAALANAAWEQPRFMTGFAFKLDGSNWIPWMPPSGHAAWRDFRSLELHSIQRDANEQKRLLDEYHEKEGIDIFVATCNCFENNKTQESVSLSTWSKTVKTLLPVTDRVGLYNPDLPKDKAMLGVAKWADVLAVAGDLMKPQGMYPERYLVDDFPSESQIQQLKLTEI